MNSTSRHLWRGLARCAAIAGLFYATTANAQEEAALQPSAAPGCVPPAYAQLPVVNTGLPIVQIWTAGLAPVLDRENYLDACMRITDGTRQHYGTGLYHGTLKIRGRGNTTWNMPKKGYRLKLTAAQPLLDMPAHKDWVLLANFADKTLMRNNLAFELSRRVGMAWTPRMRYAEFYLNNEFLGNYQIGEKIEVAPARVNITPITTTDVTPPAVEGGYLLEVDYADRIDPADDFFVNNPSGYHFVMQAPSGSDVQPAQKAYIAAYTQALENSIFAGDFNAQTGVPSRLDIDSLVNYYIVNELLKNKDAAMGSSVYLYKDRGTRLTMGPLWDFDISAGNIDFYPSAMTPDGWYLRNTTAWFDALMQTPAFKSRVIARWQQLYPSLRTITGYVDAQANALNRSQRRNFQVWPILGTYVWPNQVVTGSYGGEVAWLRNWLSARIDWMNLHINE